jgi:hypothetical protein
MSSKYHGAISRAPTAPNAGSRIAGSSEATGSGSA